MLLNSKQLLKKDFLISIQEKQFLFLQNKITFKETDALSEADLSAAVKKAETVNKDLGTKNVKVTLDTTKLPKL